MAQVLEHEMIQAVIGKLSRYEIDEKKANAYLLSRVKQSREHLEPTIWNALKRYVQRRKVVLGR